jgi:metal-sulfur cluster biosynthetic enzyme
MAVTREQVVKALQTVHDPEIRLDVWSLKLIYDIQLQADDVKIKMTLTSPGCPYAETLLEAIRLAVQEAGAKNVDIDIVWDPPWSPPEDLKWAIGAFSPWSA